MPDPVLFKMTTEVNFSIETSVLREGYHISTGPNLNSMPIIGRSAPIYTYGGSNAIQLSINLDLIALEDAKKEVTGVIRSLLALSKPMQPGVRPIPKCTITLGDVLKDFVCVLASISVHAGDQGVWAMDKNPMTASVGLQFIGLELDNQECNDWLDSEDYKQTGATFSR